MFIPCGNDRGKNYPWLEPEAQKNHISVWMPWTGQEGLPGGGNTELPRQSQWERHFIEVHKQPLCKDPGACSSVCPQGSMSINPDKKSVQFSGEMRPRDAKQPTPEHTAKKQRRWDVTLHVTTFMKINPQLCPKGYWPAW